MDNVSRWLIALTLIVSPWLLSSSTVNAQTYPRGVGRDLHQKVGTPGRPGAGQPVVGGNSGPMVLELSEATEVAPGAIAAQTGRRIEVPTIEPWPKFAGETINQARKRKAEAIAAAVNDVIGAGRATVVADGDTWRVDISGGFDLKSIRDPTGQTGPQGGSVTVPGATPTPRTSPALNRGSMGTMSLAPASGLDGSGEPSLVEIGIEGLYIASVTPVPGQTPDDILFTLESMLDSNGIPATYDSVARVLSLDNGFYEDEVFRFGSSDAGLELFFEYGTVPEPSTVLLAALGGVGLLAGRRKFAAGTSRE